jgi:hypothetical protein
MSYLILPRNKHFHGIDPIFRIGSYEQDVEIAKDMARDGRGIIDIYELKISISMSDEIKYEEYKAQ